MICLYFIFFFPVSILSSAVNYITWIPVIKTHPLLYWSSSSLQLWWTLSQCLVGKEHSMTIALSWSWCSHRLPQSLETVIRECKPELQEKIILGGIPWKITFIIYNKPWWKYTKCWLVLIATGNICPWDWYQVEKAGEKYLHTKPWDWNCKGERKIKALFTVTSAIWTVSETRLVSFKWIRKFYLCAGSEKSYYLKDILCFAVIY